MKFCFVCGKKTDKLIEGYCEDCYNEKFKLIEAPKRVYVTLCPKCGMIRQENKWVDKEIDDIIIEKIKIHGRDVKLKIEKNDIAKIYAKGFLDRSKKIKEETREVELKIDKLVCPNCSKRFGEYYESVIQLRGNITDEVLDSIDSLVLSEYQKNKKAFYRIENVKGGVDLFLGSKSIANRIENLLSKRYKSEIKKSFKLITRKEGKDIYRNIMLVRISD